MVFSKRCKNKVNALKKPNFIFTQNNVNQMNNNINYNMINSQNSIININNSQMNLVGQQNELR